jgi:hypothetical protein
MCHSIIVLKPSILNKTTSLCDRPVGVWMSGSCCTSSGQLLLLQGSPVPLLVCRLWRRPHTQPQLLWHQLPHHDARHPICHAGLRHAGVGLCQVPGHAVLLSGTRPCCATIRYQAMLCYYQVPGHAVLLSCTRPCCATIRYQAMLCYYEAMLCYYQAMLCYYWAMLCYYEAMLCSSQPALFSNNRDRCWRI